MHRSALMLSVLLSATACSRDSEARISRLEKSNADLSMQLAAAQVDLTSLRWDVLALSEAKVAVVGAGDRGYSIAQTGIGPFTVSAKKFEPYVGGYRVQLVLGNLTSATADGAKLKITWGANEKEISVTESLRPGAFNAVWVVLTPATAKDVERVRVELSTDRIRMFR